MTVATAPDPSRVLEGLTLHGQVNTDDATLLAHVQHAMRLGHPQISRQPMQKDAVVLVGSGPSLAETERELVALVHGGAKLVTMNAGYHWCLERHLKPAAQIVIDAKPSTARFLSPEAPGCRYYLASQCHPETWAAVQGRPFVGIFHAMTNDSDEPIRHALDRFYLGRWQGIGGGTTVATRAVMLLRTLGYLRFHLFGVDSCWMGAEHHALPQPENATDKRYAITVSPTEAPDRQRVFHCAPWHVQQLADFLQLIRFQGQHFLLDVRGDGLIAHAIRESAEISISEE